MKPIKDANEFTTDVQQPIPASDVSEFVGEDDTAAFGGPIGGTGGKTRSKVPFKI
jgi:hypothetical protein